MMRQWVLNHDMRFRCGCSSLGLSTGALVQVVQVDKSTSKVLIKFSDRDIDWYPESILKNFQQIA